MSNKLGITPVASIFLLLLFTNSMKEQNSKL